MVNLQVSRKTVARRAGLLYFIWILTTFYGMFYIPSIIKTRIDAVSASQNILANEFLFRTGIINDIAGSVLWIFLVLALYRLLRCINEGQAKLMVILVVVQIPAMFITASLNLTGLMILKGEVLYTFNLGHRQDLALFFLGIKNYIVLALEVFWGLWLFPLGFLIYKSQFLPRFLGIWLVINGVAYLVLSFTSLLFPQYKDLVFNIAIPAMFGEFVLMLWLLIIGARQK